MPSPDPTATPAAGVLRIFLAFALLAGWVALLAGGMLPAGGGPRFSLRFVPLGFIGVFAFTDRGFRLARAVLVAFPAFVLGFVSAALVLWLRERAAGPPGPSDLATCCGGGPGVWVGLAWRRGLLRVVLLPFKLAIGALLVCLLAAILLAWALEKMPERAAAGGARAAGRGRRVRPHRGPATEPARRAPDVASDRGGPGPPARSCLAGQHGIRPLAVGGGVFETDGRLRVSSSTRVPWTSRWLNGAASAQVMVRDGHLDLRGLRLRLARFEPAPGRSRRSLRGCWRRRSRPSDPCAACFRPSGSCT